MNPNVIYLMSVLKDYYNDLKNNEQMNDEDLSILVENLTIDLPVTFAEAALGADVKVPTLEGNEVTLRIAPGTQNGRVLRVKGKGVNKGGATGDLLVTIDVQVPRILEGKAEQAVKDFAAATAKHDVRSEFMAKAKS